MCRFVILTAGTAAVTGTIVVIDMTATATGTMTASNRVLEVGDDIVVGNEIAGKGVGRTRMMNMKSSGADGSTAAVEVDP